MNLIKLLVAIALMVTSTIAVAHKATEARVDALDARTQRIERVLDNQALLSMAKKIESLQREIQQLRGENEQLAFELNSLKERQREQYLDVDRRLQSSSSVSSSAGIPENSQVIGESAVINSTHSPSTKIPETPASQVATTTGAGVSTSVSSGEAAKDYKNSFTLLKQGKYDDSIVSFEAFLQNHPDSKYASNAQYWLAEANYVSKRYPNALTEFSKVVNQYPASSKVADARLKLGFTYYELGKYEEARIELTKLRAQFPNSSVASLAQQRLERMAREGK